MRAGKTIHRYCETVTVKSAENALMERKTGRKQRFKKVVFMLLRGSMLYRCTMLRGAFKLNWRGGLKSKEVGTERARLRPGS